jgi:hypothetical protein
VPQQQRAADLVEDDDPHRPSQGVHPFDVRTNVTLSITVGPTMVVMCLAVCSGRNARIRMLVFLPLAAGVTSTVTKQYDALRYAE